jgi:hypothetical protein
MDGKNWVVNKVQEASRKWVLKVSEVRAIAHLFCEDVSRIHFARDMTNLKSLVLDPFANQIPAMFDVPCGLWGRIVQPLYTGIVVVVESAGRVDVREEVAGIQHAARKVAEINNFLGGGVCRANLGLTRAERSALLVFAKPADWSAILENNATVHTPKFEEWEQCAIGNGTAKLRTPTQVTVHRDHVGIL